MHDHPLDLIAAFADGSLSDEAEARALVESCPECREEYRTQTEVIGWLAATPTAEMTDLEKAALHRDLWTEFRRQPGKSPATPWWQRLAYVAAGLFVTVGLVSVLNNDTLNGGADSGANTTADGAFDAPTEETPFVAQGSDDGESAPEMTTETTAAATATTAAAGAGGEESFALPFAELAEEARANQADRALTEGTDRDVEACLARVALDEHVVVDEIDLDQIYLLVMPADPEAEPIVTFVVLPRCEIVYVG
ncbi:MAG TPA: hypothetical protein VE027_03560 [Acidimicrobiia bacterium]|jgi:hypothetical protein|nr:hypothetical protein [Acidimicrobiia bacterium]